MQQEDYIKKQIDQLGRVLGKILSDLLGLKSQGSLSERIEIVDQPLKNSLNLDIEDLITIPTDNFIDTLKAENKLTNDNFEILANLLFHLADEVDDRDNIYEKKSLLYQRSLVIYEYLNSTSSTYSFDRHLKVEKIKNTL
jgi:hypothetical protein